MTFVESALKLRNRLKTAQDKIERFQEDILREEEEIHVMTEGLANEMAQLSEYMYEYAKDEI